MQEFELIIVDKYYSQRKNYFKNLNLPFPIKHVPAYPNYWLEQDMPAVAQQYNKGIIYADGELLFFSADGWIYPPHIMQLAYKLHSQHWIPLAYYITDWTFAEQITKKELNKENKNVKKPTLTYNYKGYIGKTISVDHRYNQAFNNNPEQFFPHTWWSWFFSGCACVPLKTVLQVNGFDMNFDGDKMLCDVDLGSRLDLTGNNQFLLHRNFYLIRLALNSLKMMYKKTIKCNYGLIGYNRYHKNTVANKYYLTQTDVEWIKQDFCGKKCEMKQFCKKNHEWQHPFEHKAGWEHENHFSDHETFLEWLDNQQTLNLQHERKLRIEGNKKYEEATIING